jgi:clathrin heavy chain
MDPQKLPIVYQQLFELPKILPSLSPGCLTPSNVTVSARYICVRDTGSVHVVDLNNWAQPASRALKADSTMMHPTQNILAIRAGSVLQVFDLGAEPAKKLADYTHPDADRVEFWKWIDEQTIAVVTSRSVFHWVVPASGTTSLPQKKFDRAAQLEGTTIASYEVSHDNMFCALLGTVSSGGRVSGVAQLFSVAQSGSQPIPAHACCFSRLKKAGAPDGVVFCFVKRDEGPGHLLCIEMGGAHKPQATIAFPESNGPLDYPISLVYSPKYSVLYMITHQGLFFMFDSLSVKKLMANKVSQDALIVGAPHVSASGIIGINAPSGAVLAITVNENNMVPWVLNTLNDQAMAISLAQRGGLPGLEGVFSQQFQLFMQSGQYQQAAKLAAESPRGCLRTPATIQMFKSLPSTPTSAPLRDYFTIVLDHGQLNECETMELVQPVVAQRRSDLIADWLTRDKLFCTPTLGRLVLAIDPASALKIFQKCGDKDEIAKLHAETGQYQQLVDFAKENNYKPNWMALLLSVLDRSPANAAGFAKMLLKTSGGALVDANTVVDAFMERNMIKETTSLLLDIIENTPEFGDLQTRILEINLKSVPHVPNAPQIVNAMFDNNLFSHYDSQQIATLCEQVGMYQRALQHYTDFKDVRNLIVSYGSTMQDTFLITVFQRFSLQERTELLRELLKAGQSNVQLVVSIAVKFTINPQEKTPFLPLSVVSLFEEAHTYEGTFLYLRQVVLSFKDDKDLTFKFIEAATKLNLASDVESAVRELEYDPEAVREFLKENKLDSQVPLMLLCNRHNFVVDLTNFLYRAGQTQAIEQFVQQINPMKTPQVVGALLDDNCAEEQIKSIINSVGKLCPVAELVSECESRGRLLLLRSWLEQRYNESNKEQATHNALAKILIASGDERAETFLLNNDLYDAREVGKYAEEHNPALALKIYQLYKCHHELIALTNHDGMFREQAAYLVYEQNPELWALVLKEETEQRKQLIEQVIQSTLAEITPDRADVVSSTVQAFMVAKLPAQLMELLEKIVLETPGFSDNRYLQNLLILTAIKAQRSRVMDYVTRLNHYDPEDIANMSLSYKLPEVAFAIYKKFDKNVEAIGVLINGMNNLEEANEFADQCREPAVYSVLASAQLAKGNVVASIGSFLKANDATKYEEVIAAAKQGGYFSDLVKYLTMCRTALKSATLKGKERVDSELVYALATIKSPELELFVSQTHHANISNVGETCWKEGLYEAAKTLYLSIKNYPRLVSCLLKLQNFTDAVEYARKANLAQTWKEVCKACVDATPPEMSLAQLAGGNIINNPGSDLEEIANYYEERGYTGELITLLEAGLNTETTINLSTTLAILYSKYRPEKLFAHLQLFKKKLTISKVVLITKENQQWLELSYLHELDNEVDNAARVMIEHPEVWNDLKFKELIGKAKNLELIYESIKFYLNCRPSKTVDLLSSVSTRLDPTKVVLAVKPTKQIPVIKKYLESVQSKDVREVNNTLNDLYIEEEDFESLKASVTKYQNFDSIGLAKRLETNELIEFKRIASHLYKLNKKWKQSIDLSKSYKLYQDAMETAAESKDPALAEDLLRFFVEPSNNIKSPHCFAACLYACYDLLKPDVVLELAWRYKITDFAFPYMIQFVRDTTNKLDALTAQQEAAAANQSSVPNFPPGMIPPGMMPPGMMPPGMIPSGPGMGSMPPPNGVTPQGMGIAAATPPNFHTPGSPGAPMWF